MKRILPILILLPIFAMMACKKSNSTANTAQTQSLNQLFSGLRTIPQNLSVTAGRDTMVFGTGGTMLHFYSNSFNDASGNTITSGTISLQLIEMYKPGDFICNRATTLASGQLLQSGGQINLSATKNGQAVFANKYGVGFKQANLSNQIMTLFYGNVNNADSVTNWTVSDSTIRANMAEIKDTDSNITHSYGRPWVGYVFDSASSLSYTNCDAFYGNDSPKTSISVILPDSSYNPTNTEVFIVLPSINCAMSTIEPTLGGYSWNAATHTISLISEHQSEIVPTGMNYELVVITNKSGSYYYYKTSGITTMGLTINATLVTDSQSDILAKLAGL